VGITKDPLKPLQYAKAHRPIEDTELGIVNVPVKPLQPLNVKFSIIVKELGSNKDPLKPVQPSKALLPIDLTELGIINEPTISLHS
jgi:hypothetical protein